MTYAQLIEHLSKPENAGDIRYLSYLKKLENVKNIKTSGLKEKIIAKTVLHFMKKHIEAVFALSDCKSAEDLSRFKQTEHYDKIAKLDLGNITVPKALAALELLDSVPQKT